MDRGSERVREVEGGITDAHASLQKLIWLRRPNPPGGAYPAIDFLDDLSGSKFSLVTAQGDVEQSGEPPTDDPPPLFAFNPRPRTSPASDNIELES